VTDEPLYTLEQARRILTHRECLDFGHDLYLDITPWVGLRSWQCRRGCGVIVEFRYPDEEVDMTHR